MAFEENLKCCGHHQPSGLLTERPKPFEKYRFLKIPKCGLNLLVVGLHSLNPASTLPTTNIFVHLKVAAVTTSTAHLRVVQ